MKKEGIIVQVSINNNSKINDLFLRNDTKEVIRFSKKVNKIIKKYGNFTCVEKNILTDSL